MARSSPLASILETLELQQYFEIFEEQEVDLKTLLELNDSELKELIPKLGHRKKLRKWIIESTSTLSVQEEEKESVNAIMGLETCSNVSTVIFDGLMETSAEGILDALNASEVTLLDQDPMKETESEKFVLVKSGIYQTNIFGDGKNLEGFLRASKIGSALLTIYKEHDKLNDLEMARLVHMFADHLCENNERISNVQWAGITEELLSLFPNEISRVYYVPAVGARRISSGKLVDRFRNQKKIVTKSRKKACEPEQEPNPELAMKLEWLKRTADPRKKVEDWWEDTRPIRSSECTINTYIKLFPALQMPLGYLLLETDFIHQHPGKDTALLSYWGNIAPKLWEVLKKKPQAALQGCYTDYPDKNVSDLHLLRALPAALPCPVHKISKTKLWKPSFSEAQDGFILVVKNEADLPAALQQSRDKLLHLGLTAQSLITAVCPEDNILVSSQLHIDNFRYQVPCLIRTLDLSFKLSMVLNAEYAFEAKNVFLFLRRYIYEIETPYDKMTSSIANLIGELKKD